MLLVRQDETRIVESNSIIVTYSELWTVMKQRSVNNTCTYLCCRLNDCPSWFTGVGAGLCVP
jgi:hypothetical protein